MSVSEPSAGQTASSAVAPAAAAAGAAAGGAAGTAAGAAGVGAGLATLGAGAVAAGAMMAALISFLALLAESHRRWLTRELGRFSKSPDDIAQVIAEEMRLEQAFAQNSADRLAAALPQALKIADPAQRSAAVQGLLEDEKRYAQQREEAMAARAIAAVTRAQLRRDSPLGAWWVKGYAKDPTPGCIFMAGGERPGSGRFWPWPVLDRVHPPRHYGCPDALRGFGEGVTLGLGGAGAIPDTRDAIRAAAGVVMEQEDAEALLRELDVRELLAEQGIDTSGIPWVGLEEAFDAAEHPRDWHGRWMDAFHFTTEAKAKALLKDGVTAKVLGGGNYGRGFYVSQHPQGPDDAYGPVGLRLRIKLDKPLVLDDAGSKVLKGVNDEVGAELDREGLSRFGREWDNRVTAKLQAKGYDGVHVPWGSPESGGHYYVVFDPRRVKIVGRHPPEPGGGGTAKPEDAAAALQRGEPSAIRPEDAAKLVDSLADGKPSSLHLLQVDEHPNLFWAHARELSRAQMPQVRKADLPGFMDFLRSKRIGATVERVAPSDLRATQNQINGAAVAALAKGWDPARGGILMVSKDGDVLDGHHRWAAAALYEMTHPGYKVDVLRFRAGTDRILSLMRAYGELSGAQPRAFGEGSQALPKAGAA